MGVAGTVCRGIDWQTDDPCESGIASAFWNIGANVTVPKNLRLKFQDGAGLSMSAGLAANDVLQVIYADDRWVEVSRSNN